MTAESWQLVLQGLRITLLLTGVSALIAVVVGTLITVLRIGSNRLLRNVAVYYIEFFRNIPILVVLFFIYFGLPSSGLRLSAFACAAWGLGLYTAAYVAEILRTGIDAVGRGQIEAARSLGLSYTQMLRLVLLPQAFRIAIPPLGTLLIALLKNTAIASSITVPELLYQADIIESRTFYPGTYPLIGLVYVLVNIPLGLLVGFIEQRAQIVR
jgi:His/Glu/Gln/Arg/opine family amino acid ABC transporter permease subunit